MCSRGAGDRVGDVYMLECVELEDRESVWYVQMISRVCEFCFLIIELYLLMRCGFYFLIR